jgi:hypothetical protein
MMPSSSWWLIGMFAQSTTGGYSTGLHQTVGAWRRAEARRAPAVCPSAPEARPTYSRSLQSRACTRRHNLTNWLSAGLMSAPLERDMHLARRMAMKTGIDRRRSLVDIAERQREGAHVTQVARPHPPVKSPRTAKGDTKS